jgi:hypothetical protein
MEVLYSVRHVRLKVCLLLWGFAVSALSFKMKKNENTVMNILKRSNHMDNADIILLLLGLGISLNSCTGYKIFFSATSLVFH